jgi:hypothetical protein
MRQNKKKIDKTDNITYIETNKRREQSERKSIKECEKER